MSTQYEYSYSIQGGPAPAFPPQQFLEQRHRQRQDLPSQQYDQRNAVAPLFSRTKRSSFRPPSSVYSQPSPVSAGFPTNNQQPQQQQPQLYQEDPYRYHPSRPAPRPRNADGVSPESSPELSPVTPAYGRPPTPPSPIQFAPPPAVMPPTTTTREPRSASGSSATASRSNIPMMRRERRQNQEAASRTLRESKSRDRLVHQQEEHEKQQQRKIDLLARGYKGGEVRWDPRTGELTSSEKGRPSQVKPIEYARGLGITGNDPPSPTESPTPSPTPAAAAAVAGVHETAANALAGFASRLRRTVGPKSTQTATAAAPASPVSPAGQPPRTAASTAASTDPAANAFTSERPPWQGASGRTALVAPVRDTTDVAPLVIPRRSSKRVASATQLRTAAAKAANNNISATASPQTPVGAGVGAAAAASYPSPPMSGPGGGSSADKRVSSMSIKRKPMPVSSHQALGSFDQDDPFNYNNRPPATFASHLTSSPKVSAVSESRNMPPVDDGWVQPPSRFSVTTYASTPRESLNGFDVRDVPDMPPMPSHLRNAGSNSTPLPGDDNEPIMISLKTPWMSGGSRATTPKTPKTPNRDLNNASPSTKWLPGSVHKVLPPAPPETIAKDRVAMLNAQLSGLAQRRMNIDRSIKQMTELMPTDNLLASADVLRKREMEKRKVEGLRMELAEIQREEYEIGLKLHRAYKRLDRDAEYEPTTLWVRRVTG